MQEQEDQLKAIGEMRDLMKRSTRFLSLSGLSGISSGIFALVGSFLGWYALRHDFFRIPFDIREWVPENADSLGFFVSALGVMFMYRFMLAVGTAVLFLALLSAWWFSRRKAKRAGVNFWDESARRMLINLFIPLVAGGIFCLVLMWHGIIGLVAPATLIFYGLGLLNASKYTLEDIRYLGLMEIGLGILGLFFIGYGLLFWAIGFGLLHIIYGAVMYFKYDMKRPASMKQSGRGDNG